MNYEDLDALDIELEYEDREAFAMGYLTGFSEVDCIESGSFKERVCFTTICERDDGSYWSYQWRGRDDSVGSESNDFNMDSYIHRVDRLIIGTTRTVVDWVRSRP